MSRKTNFETSLFKGTTSAHLLITFALLCKFYFLLQYFSCLANARVVSAHHLHQNLIATVESWYISAIPTIRRYRDVCFDLQWTIYKGIDAHSPWEPFLTALTKTLSVDKSIAAIRNCIHLGISSILIQYDSGFWRQRYFRELFPRDRRYPSKRSFHGIFDACPLFLLTL